MNANRIFSFSLLSILICSCYDETYYDNPLINDISNDIVISNGIISSPTWMVEKIDSIRNQVSINNEGIPLSPSVIKVSNKKSYYYNIVNPFAQEEAGISNYYMADGKKVQRASELYKELAGNEQRTLIWDNSLSAFQPTAKTRTKISQVDYVYTPKGSTVSGCWETAEGLNQDDIEFRYNAIQTSHPNVEILSPATDTYNCHSYAWYRQSLDNNIWMGDNSIPVYWQDHSYEQVISFTNADKVVYSKDGVGIHSAVTTSTPNVVISKWGENSLVRHMVDDCSYYEGSTLTYYKRNYRPNFYISNHSGSYAQSEFLVYATNNYASLTMFAFAPYSAPTSYVWTALGGDGCNRWYSYPNGSRIDLSIYLPSYGSCTIVLTCDMSANNTLLGTAQCVIRVLPGSPSMYGIESQNKEETDE